MISRACSRRLASGALPSAGASHQRHRGSADEVQTELRFQALLERSRAEADDHAEQHDEDRGECEEVPRRAHLAL
jgi:hypothetical protein